jgi:hypothetical protein
MVDAVQSHWASLAAAVFGAAAVAFEPVALAAAPEDAVFLFLPMTLEDFFEVSGLGRGSNGRLEAREEMSRRARMKRIKPWIPFIKEKILWIWAIRSTPLKNGRKSGSTRVTRRDKPAANYPHYTRGSRNCLN